MTEPERNAGQIEYWNGDVGRRWARLQDQLDALFGDVTATAIEAASPHEGERALDIGCGCGASVLALAQWVGSTGHVLGIDISEVMLDVARRRIASRKIENATLALADAAVERFEPGVCDLAFSRFGVMFFDQPTEAFANIKRSLKPGGRLAFVCWRPYKDNPFFSAPHWAAKPFLPTEEEAVPDPDAPGPFAFADPDRVRRILGDSGFTSITIEPADVMLPLAPPGDLDTATRFIVQIGPVARALASADAEQRRQAEAAVTKAIAPFDGAEGVRLPARIWVVSASVMGEIHANAINDSNVAHVNGMPSGMT